MGNRTSSPKPARPSTLSMDARANLSPISAARSRLDGPVLAVRSRTAHGAAQALGWTPSRDADLHLLVDGEVHRPLAEGDAAVFLVSRRRARRSARVEYVRSGADRPGRQARTGGFPVRARLRGLRRRDAARLPRRPAPCRADCTATKPESAPTGVGQGRVGPRPAILGGPHRTYRRVRQPQRSDDAPVDPAGATRGGRSRQEQEQTEALLGSVIRAIGRHARPQRPAAQAVSRTGPQKEGRPATAYAIGFPECCSTPARTPPWPLARR